MTMIKQLSYALQDMKKIVTIKKIIIFTEMKTA